jgi:protein-disulfide isomerase
MRPSSIRIGLAGMLLVLQACAGQQVGKLSTRVDTLEARDKRLVELEQRLAKIEEQNQRLTQLVEMMASQFESVKVVADALANMNAEGAGEAEPPGPDPSAVYSVPVDGSPVEGPDDAKITIVKAFEFACPFCERARPTLAQLRSQYGNDVRIVYKHYIVHQDDAVVPARAVCAAHMQGKFTAMKDAIWDQGFKAGRDLSLDNMKRQARRLGLNMKRFEKDMNGACVERVERDHALLTKVGVTGTPYFYVNGRLIRGAMPIESFRQVIDEELTKANQVIQTQGVKAGDYYQTEIVAKGRTEP